jgi:hypothetical protein
LRTRNERHPAGQTLHSHSSQMKQTIKGASFKSKRLASKLMQVEGISLKFKPAKSILNQQSEGVYRKF